jgi:hypothetical protein
MTDLKRKLKSKEFLCTALHKEVARGACKLTELRQVISLQNQRLMQDLKANEHMLNFVLPDEAHRPMWAAMVPNTSLKIQVRAKERECLGPATSLKMQVRAKERECFLLHKEVARNAYKLSELRRLSSSQNQRLMQDLEASERVMNLVQADEAHIAMCAASGAASSAASGAASSAASDMVSGAAASSAASGTTSSAASGAASSAASGAASSAASDMVSGAAASSAASGTTSSAASGAASSASTVSVDDRAYCHAYIAMCAQVSDY